MLTLETLYDFQNPGQKTRFEKRLDQKVKTLDKLLAKDSHPNGLRVKTETLNHSQTKVSLQLHLRHETLMANRVADDPTKALELTFDILKETLLQYLEKQRDVSARTRRVRQTEALEAELESLTIEFESNDRKAFESRLFPLLTDLKRYIQRQIRYAQITGAIEPRSVLSRDLVNEVIVNAYDQFMTRPDYLSLEQWVYSLADTMLVDHLNEAEYERKHTQSWEQYLEQEIDDMDERLVLDAEGDVYVEDEFEDGEVETAIQTLDIPVGDLSAEPTRKSKQYRRILKALSRVPAVDRSIFDLFALDGLSVEHIAAIKHLKKREVERTIELVRVQVKKQLQIANGK